MVYNTREENEEKVFLALDLEYRSINNIAKTTKLNWYVVGMILYKMLWEGRIDCLDLPSGMLFSRKQEGMAL